MITKIMELFKKLLMLCTLVCYLAVSSIAAAHAFPSLNSEVAAESGALQVAVVNMSPSCHQSGLTSGFEGDKDVSSSTSVGSCKIFCSAMANVIPDEIAYTLSSVKPSIAIAFLAQGLLFREIAVEPQPPK